MEAGTETTSPPIKMTRDDAINLLRKTLQSLTDEDHCACEVAAQKGIMCRGFAHYSDSELRRRYWWLARRNPNMPRADLERLANRWQLGRQVYQDVDLSCDVQQIEKDTCAGWDSFSNEALVKFVRELAGISAEIA